eukprot:6214072-Pleurochrysis_carterae.AAC.2
MSSVRGVFQEIFGTGIAPGAKKGSRSLDEYVRLLQFTLVSGRHVWKPNDVLAIADRGRSTVCYVGLEETTDGKGRTRWRGYDSGVGTGGASLEQSGVD